MAEMFTLDTVNALNSKVWRLRRSWKMARSELSESSRTKAASTVDKFLDLSENGLLSIFFEKITPLKVSREEFRIDFWITFLTLRAVKMLITFFSPQISRKGVVMFVVKHLKSE